MTSPHGEFDDREPLPVSRLSPGPLPARRSWPRQNWLGLSMFAVMVIQQIVTASGWATTRSGNEAELGRQVAALSEQLKQMNDTYVRKDVLDQMMRRFEDHLASIDAKVSTLQR